MAFIVGRDVQRTTRCTGTVLELLSAGKAFRRLRADDDIDLRAFRGELIGEQLERRGTHATAGEQGATCAVRNVPAIADGTDEVDFVADDDMRELLGTLPHNLIADVNGAGGLVDIEDGKGHAQELDGRLARDLDLNELSGTRRCGDTGSLHGQMVDALGNLLVEEYGATFPKLLVHVLAFPSAPGST